MPTWLFEIFFFSLVFGPIFFWIVALMVAGAVGARLGELLFPKPKASEHVDTPEEAAARKARTLAMVAQMEKTRLAAHHH